MHHGASKGKPKAAQNPARVGDASLLREFRDLRVFEAAASMRREGWSATRAAREAGTTVATMRSVLGRILERTSSGRYRIRPSDQLTRQMWVLTEAGEIPVAVRGSRQASRLGEYRSALGRFLAGETDALDPFAGESLRIGGRLYPFITDQRIIKRLAYGQEIATDAIYVYVV